MTQETVQSKELEAWLATQNSSASEGPLDADDDIGNQAKCTLLHVKPSIGAQVSYVVKRSSGKLEREYYFYNSIGKQSSQSSPSTTSSMARVPNCLFSSYENGAVVLVLEFLSMPDWAKAVDHCTHQQAVTAVETLGHMHKHFSGDVLLQPELAWLPDSKFVDFDTYICQSFLVRALHDHDSRNNHVRSMVQAFPTDVQIILDWMAVGGYVECQKRLSQPPLALNHGDYHFNNLRFHAEHLPPEVAVFDWGSCYKARGITDFGFFLLTSLSPEDRRQHEQELLMRYLKARGDAEVNVAECWEDLKAVAVGVLFTLVLVHLDDSAMGDPTKSNFIENIKTQVIEAMMDWQVIELASKWAKSKADLYIDRLGRRQD